MGGLDPLRAAVAALAAEDLSCVPAVELGERVVELRRLIDGLEGAWSRLVAAVDGSGSVEAGAGTGAWLRSACRLSPAAARRQVVLSRRLAVRPSVGAALSAGEISVEHARLVTRALDELAEAGGPQLATDAAGPMVTAARRCDPARLRREIAHARHALVPDAALATDEQAVARRRLDVATTFDGTVVVNGVLDPEGGEALLTALTPLTTPTGPGDTRTPGRRRADALIELSHRALDSAALPTLGGERPHLTVLVPLSTLLPATTAATTAATDAQTAAAHTAGTHTAATHTAATGAVTAGTAAMVGAETIWGAVLGPHAARRIACDASITRVILDPDSQPLDIGRRTRLIPPAIRTALTVRDRGCIFPGCDRPPPWTDAHHLQHWADGGPTTLDNLALLCRTHHRTVHEGHWTLTRAPTGRWTVTRAGPARPRAA